MDYTEYIKKIFEPIKNDNVSGSTDIALKVVELLKKFLSRKDLELSTELYKTISNQLISAQPSMGIILNLAYSIGKIKKIKERDELLHYLDMYRVDIEEHKANIAKRASKLIKNKHSIMVYSSSSTVFETLKYAHNCGPRFRVIVLESRPMDEGRDMMIKLSKLFIPIIFVTDAAGMSMLTTNEVDAVLIGGDAILRKHFICKVGTYAIAVLCKQNDIPIYGLCGTEKIVPRELEDKFTIVDKPAHEITTYKNRSVKVINRYFEKVPIKLFTKIVTDH